MHVKGYIELLTTFETAPLLGTINVKYLVVNYKTPYNTLLGHLSLNAQGAIISTLHLAMKFPISTIEVGVVYANQKEAQQCYNESLEELLHT